MQKKKEIRGSRIGNHKSTITTTTKRKASLKCNQKQECTYSSHFTIKSIIVIIAHTSSLSHSAFASIPSALLFRRTAESPEQKKRREKEWVENIDRFGDYCRG